MALEFQQLDNTQTLDSLTIYYFDASQPSQSAITTEKDSSGFHIVSYDPNRIGIDLSNELADLTHDPNYDPQFANPDNAELQTAFQTVKEPYKGGILSRMYDGFKSAANSNNPLISYGAKAALLAVGMFALSTDAHAQSCGDGDANGRVDVIDALQAAKIASGLQTPVDQAGQQRLDVIGPNGITVLDPLRIAQFATGLDPEGTGFLYCATDDAPLTKFHQHGDTGTHATSGGINRENSTSFIFQHYTIPGTTTTIRPSMTLGDGIVYGPEGAVNLTATGLVAQISIMPGQNLATFYNSFNPPINPSVLTGKQMTYQGELFTVTEATVSPILNRLSLEAGMDVALNATPQTFDAGSAMYHDMTGMESVPGSQAMLTVNGMVFPADVSVITAVLGMNDSYVMVTSVSPSQVNAKIEYGEIEIEDNDPTNPAYTGTFTSWGTPRPNVLTKIETSGGNISGIVQEIDEPTGPQSPSRILVDPEGGSVLETLLRAGWKGTNTYKIQFLGRIESGQTTTHAFAQDSLDDNVINLTYILPDGVTQVVAQFYHNQVGAPGGFPFVFFNMDERGSTDTHPVKEGNKFLFTAYDGLKWVSEIMTYINLAGGNLNLLRGDGTPLQVPVGQDITIPTESGRTASQNYEVGLANALAVNNDSNPVLEVNQQALFYLHTTGADSNHYFIFHTNDIQSDGKIPSFTAFFDVVEPANLYPLGSQPDSIFGAAISTSGTYSAMFINLGTTTTTIGPEKHKLFPSLNAVYSSPIGATGGFRNATFTTTGPSYAPLDIKKINPNP